MFFAELVQVSAGVGATSSRHEKIARLGEWLRRLSSDEIAVGVHYLSGRLPQGRIGVGGSLLRAQAPTPAERATLTLREIDDAFTRLAATSGSGAGAARQRQLQALFERATAQERDFLGRLLTGELRQGALEGIMLEALAFAA